MASSAPDGSPGVLGAITRRIFGDAESQQDGERPGQEAEAGGKAGTPPSDGKEPAAKQTSDEQAAAALLQDSPAVFNFRTGETFSPATLGGSHPVDITPSSTPFSSAATSPTSPQRSAARQAAGDGGSGGGSGAASLDLEPLSLRDSMDSPSVSSQAPSGTTTPTGPRPGSEPARGIPAVRTRLESPAIAASPTTNIVDQLMGEVVAGRLTKESEGQSESEPPPRRELLSELQQEPADGQGSGAAQLPAQPEAAGAGADTDAAERGQDTTLSGVLGRVASRKRGREGEDPDSPQRPVTPKLAPAQGPGGELHAGAAQPASELRLGSPPPVGAFSSSVAVKPTTAEAADLSTILQPDVNSNGSTAAAAVAAAPGASVKSEAAGLAAAGLPAGTPAKEAFLGSISSGAEDGGEGSGSLREARQALQADAAAAADAPDGTPAQAGKDLREPMESVQRDLVQAAAAPAIASLPQPAAGADLPAQASPAKAADAAGAAAADGKGSGVAAKGAAAAAAAAPSQERAKPAAAAAPASKRKGGFLCCFGS